MFSSGGPKKKRSSVGPLPLFPQSAPYKVAGPGNTPTAGGRSNVKPVKRFDPNDPAHLDAVELANGWTRFLTNDGLHLREHRWSRVNDVIYIIVCFYVHVILSHFTNYCH